MDQICTQCGQQLQPDWTTCPYCNNASVSSPEEAIGKIEQFRRRLQHPRGRNSAIVLSIVVIVVVALLLYAIYLR